MYNEFDERDLENAFGMDEETYNELNHHRECLGDFEFDEDSESDFDEGDFARFQDDFDDEDFDDETSYGWDDDYYPEFDE